jgi:hypothetical protein
LYRKLVREADGVFAVSEHFRSLLAASADFPETAVGVVPNPVPSAFFEQPLDEPRDLNELLYVGHRLESKGTPVLLEAFAIARMVRPDLRRLSWTILGAAAFGAIVGSFLNVCITRIPAGISIVAPASRCPKCGVGIKPYDNIPVLSWLILGGKCRNCHAAISSMYLFVRSSNSMGL